MNTQGREEMRQAWHTGTLRDASYQFVFHYPPWRCLCALEINLSFAAFAPFATRRTRAFFASLASFVTRRIAVPAFAE